MGVSRKGVKPKRCQAEKVSKPKRCQVAFLCTETRFWVILRDEAKSGPLKSRRKDPVCPNCLIGSSADLPLTPGNRLCPHPNNSSQFLLYIATILGYNSSLAGWTRSACRVGGRIPSSGLFDNRIPHRHPPHSPLPHLGVDWGRFGGCFGALWGCFGVALGSL